MSGRLERWEAAVLTAVVAAGRGTCPRRRVGCVLVDGHYNVLATGYNGPPRGAPHCIDAPCVGAQQPMGFGLHLCEAVHAEANAILQCRERDKILECICTHSPCNDCVKLLLQTSCARISFLEPYPHELAKARWERAGRSWHHLGGVKVSYTISSSPVRAVIGNVKQLQIIDAQKCPRLDEITPSNVSLNPADYQ